MSLVLKRSRQRQAGLTLLEILVAMTLGLVLIGGILYVYLGSKTYYRVQEGLSRVQENGRFAMEFITQDLRMAGYMGCVSRIASGGEDRRRRRNTLNNAADFLYDFFGSSVVGFEFNTATNNWIPQLTTNLSYTGAANRSATEDITALTESPLVGTDVLSIRTVSSPTSATVGVSGTPRMLNGDSHIPITMPSDDIDEHDLIIIADCDQAAVTQVTNDPATGASTIQHLASAPNPSEGQPGNNGAITSGVASSVNLGKPFDELAQIFHANLVTYYIANGLSGEPTLWRLLNSTPKGGTNPTELIEGIENMQILYGQDTDTSPDGNADIYVAANNVTDVDTDGTVDWDRVVSVRVSLLVRTEEDGLADAAQPYLFNGVVTTPNDRRLRRIFTSTTALRNDVP